MELSLAQLQAQFKAAQQVQAVNRLSERNCVELILKLIDTNRIQVQYTLNGREYVTPQQLEKEILREIEASKGRINVTELVPLLNIDLDPIEKKVTQIVNKNGRFQLIGGEIITNSYLDGIALELNEMLQERGTMSMQEAASRFALTIEVTEPALIQRLGRHLFGFIEDGCIYTDSFTERYQCQIRGVFSAITRPTSISSIINRYNFQPKLFHSTLDKLIREGRVQGSHNSGTYTPFAFSNARLKQMDSFFHQNKYISYQMLEKLDYNQPKVFLEGRFPGGLGLRNHYVDSSLLSQVNGVVDEAISSEYWSDLQPVIPSAFSEKEVMQILESCSSVIFHGKNTNGMLLADYYLVSKAFIDKCIQIVEEVIKDRAERGLIQCTAQEDVKDVEEEEEPSRGRKGAKGKKSTAPAKKTEALPKKKGGKTESGGISPEEQEVTERIKKEHDEIPDELMGSILSIIRPTIKISIETHARALFIRSSTTDDNNKKSKGTNIRADMATVYSNIFYFRRVSTLFR